MLRQDVVVDDRSSPHRPLGAAPLPSTTRTEAPGRDCSISRAQLRFTDAGQTTRYGPPGAAWRSDDDRLPRLAEPHVVGQDGAAAAEQESDAFDLMREEPVRRARRPCGRPRLDRSATGRAAGRRRRPARRALYPSLFAGGLRPAGPPIAVARGGPMPRSAPAGLRPVRLRAAGAPARPRQSRFAAEAGRTLSA